MTFTYRYHQSHRDKQDAQREVEEAETLQYLMASIETLTGGCEICVHNEAQFCAKHRHPVKDGDPRCADFARRFTEKPEETSRAQSEKLIRDYLGLSEKSLNRIIGGSEP